MLTNIYWLLRSNTVFEFVSTGIDSEGGTKPVKKVNLRKCVNDEIELNVSEIATCRNTVTPYKRPNSIIQSFSKIFLRRLSKSKCLNGNQLCNDKHVVENCTLHYKNCMKMTFSPCANRNDMMFDEDIIVDYQKT